LVRLKKALYGTIEAARAWYDKLSTDLVSIGFTINTADRCVFHRTESCGGQTTICVHVDDGFAHAPTELLLDELFAQLAALYPPGSDGEPSLTIQRGRSLDYVGMVFDFTGDQSVRVTQFSFVSDLLSDVDDLPHFGGLADSPAAASLFTVSADALPLDNARRERFHSLVAKFLYLAKRTRPDLLVAVSFLARRVLVATVEDWKKLSRLVRYLRATQELGICLSGDLLSVACYTDASHAVDDGMKGRTGSFISIGDGPVFARSVVQSIVTLSSAESELVALADSLPQVLWTRYYLESHGFDVPAAVVHEDNTSAMHLAANGRSNSSRTRHIALRYFFITDRIRSGEIKLQYINTDAQIADILTKPLQGEHFRRLRKLLLNW
jgi:hypothetical protein